MKLYDMSLIIIGTIIAIAAVVGVCSKMLLGHDNPVEEQMEEVIESELHIPIDLSPSSPEK